VDYLSSTASMIPLSQVKHPEQKRVSAVAQAAGEKWRSMTAAEKQRFEDLSSQSKVRHSATPPQLIPFQSAYKREMAEYNMRNPPEIRKGNKRPSDAIKRPMSAYLFFLQNFRTAFEVSSQTMLLSLSCPVRTSWSSFVSQGDPTIDGREVAIDDS